MPKVILALLLSSFPFICSLGYGRALDCHSPYKGQHLTMAMLKPILEAHQQWLKAGAKSNITGRADLCGVDLHGLNLAGVDLSRANLAGTDLSHTNLQDSNLSAADLYKTYLRFANLQQANLQSVNLQAAVLDDANLIQANLRLAHLQKASFRHANLKEADFRSAHLSEADLSHAILMNADFTWANLTQANLSYSNLSAANFSEAILKNSQLLYSKLAGANFTQADLHNVLYEPELGYLPNLVSLASSQGFRSMRFADIEGTAALMELRSAYKKIGIRNMERQITAMVKNKQMHQSWQEGGWGYFESTLSYIFFYLPSDFGAAPGRALFTFFIFVFFFAILYYVSLVKPSNKGIMVISWRARNRQYLASRAQEFKMGKTLEKIIRKRHASQCRSRILEHVRLARIALYFSLLSAFRIGWDDFNISNWILHMQKREYQLQGFGWLRVLAGIQALISAYLIVLWALTYFGRPFEW